MALLITDRARARVNHGRWIADCPRPYCNNAIRITARQAVFHCEGEGGCRMIAEIEWPADPDGIWEALEERPVPATRNWYPPGYMEAVKLSLPHGQTVAELRAEHAEHDTSQGGQ